MLDYANYRGNKVIIYDEKSKKTIAETVIVDFNISLQLIIVDSSKFTVEGIDHVSVLVLGDNGIFEYRGTTRTTGGKDTLGIALYNGKPKESRKYTRYAVDAPATVESIMAGGKRIPLPQKAQANVVNISSEGILIQGKAGLFNVNTSFQLRLTVAQEGLVLTATVVRIGEAQEGLVEYGCKLKAQAEADSAEEKNESEV